MYERCKFCKIFWEIPKKYWANSHRKCATAEKLVTIDDGCSKLELTPYIRCMKFDEQVPTLACIQRQKDKTYIKCTKCRQGKELLKLFWELNRVSKPIIKPKRKLIRKEK